MEGTWEGNMATLTSTTTMTLVMRQVQANVEGTYTAVQTTVFGASGTVSGITTGSSFLVTLSPFTAGCHAVIQLAGANDGVTMAYSFTGIDCSSATIAGEGTFNKS